MADHAPGRRDDFSLQGFRAILVAALASHDIIPFRELETVSGQKPFLIMRHDVDHSLDLALDMAREERRLGVRSTYFVMVGTANYNILSPGSKRIIREIAGLDHEIGLHYDATNYSEAYDIPEAQFRLELALLSSIAGQSIISASAHNPVNAGVLDVAALVHYHTYSPQFMERIPYISDSNQAWRQWHPLDLVEQGRSFHLLLHPLWWVLPGTDWEQKLQKVERQSQARCAALMKSEVERQRLSLRNRVALDSKFQRLKS